MYDDEEIEYDANSLFCCWISLTASKANYRERKQVYWIKHPILSYYNLDIFVLWRKLCNWKAEMCKRIDVGLF